jgi:hypothetical protein
MPISIFLSRSQPINKEQKDFIDKLCSWLKNRGFTPRTLGVSDYSTAAPLEAIRSLMSETNGLLCIAFRRTHIATGTRIVRVGKEFESKAMNDQWLTSPWTQIEPAMAYQIGLPILILRESGVLDDGVLEKGIVGLYMPEFDLTTLDEDHYLDSQEWAGVSVGWEQQVRNVVTNKGKPPKLY